VKVSPFVTVRVIRSLVPVLVMDCCRTEHDAAKRFVHDELAR